MKTRMSMKEVRIEAAMATGMKTREAASQVEMRKRSKKKKTRVKKKGKRARIG